MKDQFQSTETLRIRLTPFVNKTSGDYVVTGLDVCTLTIKKPDGTLYPGGPHLATWDSDVYMWIFDIAPASYQQGEWRVLATSNDVDSLRKWANYVWGDYVNDIATIPTINTKIGTPVSSVSADIASVQTKLGTPVGASVSADIASVQTAASAAQSSSAIASTNTTDMRKMQLNRWKVDNNQLTVYENDQSTVYKVFDLLDENQNPSSLRIYERVPV